MSRPKRNTFDVFIGNLPNSVDKNYVDQMFRTCGEISSVSVLPSRFHNSKLAYVRFHCEPDALKAVEKYKTLTLNGNSLEVKLMPPRYQNNSSFKNAASSSNTDGVHCGNGDGTSSTDTGMMSTVFNQVSIPCSLEKPAEITIVCHIENPVTFYGQNISNLLEISKISEKLQVFGLTFTTIHGLPHVNQIYATRFSQDQMFYRCRVIHVDVSKSFVSYIDYGNAEYVSNKDIVLLPDDLVRIPPQSSMFVFKDLKPVSVDENKELYDKAINYMKKMVNEKVQLQTVFSTDSFNYINKCIFHNKDIYEEIQKKGFAKKDQSSNEKLNQSEKNKLNVSGNNVNNGDSLLGPRGKLQQNTSSKANSRNTKSTYSTTVTNSKKQSVKNSGKELEGLRLENARLVKELALEKEKSKVLLKENEALKAKLDANCFEKLDTVVQKIQQLMVMRSQGSSEGTDELEEIYDVIQAKLLDETQMVHANSDLHARVEKAILEYKNAVEEVGMQEQESEVPVLVNRRDEACKVACDLMKEYLESWNGDHLTERVVYLKKLLLEMKQKYEEHLKSNVNSDDKSLDDLIEEYKGSKLKNKSSMDTALKNTNDALSQFSSVIDILKKDITVPDGKENEEDGVGIKFNTTAFADSFKEVQHAVDAEINARDKVPRNAENETMMSALVKILIKEIETPLEAALQQIKDCKQYNLLYPELCSNLATKPDTSKIYEIRKEIKMLKSKLRHKLADKKDLEESDEMNTSALSEINASLDALLHELHTCFKVEHEEMMKLVNAYKLHFRELNISNPDLNLSHYLKCDGLVKEHWEIEHFNHSSIAKRPGICYSAKFCDELVVIKEFLLNCDEYSQFLNKALPWHSIKDDNVVPIQAVFRSKTGFQTYVVFPHFLTLEESEKEFSFSQSRACQVLQDVLKGLEHIHSQGLVHSQLNPATILINSNTALLDFSFGLSHVNTVWESKGIIFCPPEKEMSQASDMYNFGCLILWMLFPNLQFACTSSGVLDIAGYKSIVSSCVLSSPVQDVLSNINYEAVASLLSAETSTRLSAKSLLEKGIFNELITNSSNEDPSPTSTPVSRTSEEISMVVSGTSEECSEPSSSDVASPSES